MNIEYLQECLKVLKEAYNESCNQKAKRLNDEIYGNLEVQHIMGLIAESEDILESFKKDVNKKFTEEDYRKLVTNTIVVFNNISHPISKVHGKANTFLMALKDSNISGNKTIGEVLVKNEDFIAAEDSRIDYVEETSRGDFFEFII